MRFCTLTLGCKVNQYDTGTVERILCSRGHILVTPGDGCDVCIVNTCAVTGESVRKSRQAIRRMRKLEPDAPVAVCGCFSELEPGSAAKLSADLIGGTSGREEFALKVEKLAMGAPHSNVAAASGTGSVTSAFSAKPDLDVKSVLATKPDLDVGAASVTKPDPNIKPSLATEPDSNIKPSLATEPDSNIKPSLATKPDPNIKPSLAIKPTPHVKSNRTRALLKIQDGCDNFCAYCVVPYARGRSRSVPTEDIAKQAKQLEEQGYKEIVITGIEISSYGKDLASDTTGKDLASDTTLVDAIQTIGKAAPKARLRLGSLDPSMVSDEFCEKLSDIPNICNHFHLSLQSGCDSTLGRMGRRYNTSIVLQKISSLRKHFSDCGITADLIVGFPGETGDEFAQTLAFIKKAAFSDMHIFPFSLRPGTKAANMPEQIDKSVKRERARKAAKAASQSADRFKRAQTGKTVRVLFEQEKNGYSIGHSSNYLEIAVKDKAEKNSLHYVRITNLRNNLLLGEITMEKENCIQNGRKGEITGEITGEIAGEITGEIKEDC